MGGVYKVTRWNGFIFHDIRTKFHDDWFSCFSNVKVTTTIILEAVMLILLI
jgi:hypothetical protein